MKILSMTATFGKLEHQTLTLKEGLNVIHAPNEWGKSTWCAFLVAMLYGIDTRERNTQTSLADKEHYKPWFGSPMSGRMDINWNGREITLERSSKGRIPMGEFSAYETATGLPVTELTGENCGQLLLGVEKSVFTRAGFIRLTDMPVTDDESLRRRLNALVTTGDESGASDVLEKKLKDLKNNCRHNKTGLLPQAEAQRDSLEKKLSQLQNLQTQSAQIRQRQEVLDTQIKTLENHQVALNFAAARENTHRVEAALAARDTAVQEMQEAAKKCENLPSEETAESTLQQLESLQQQWTALQTEAIPTAPTEVTAPPPFAGLNGAQAVAQANSDYDALQMLQKPLSPMLLILAIISLLAGVALALVQWYLLLPFLVLAVVFFLSHLRNQSAQGREKQAILSRYNGISPQLWVSMARQYQEEDATHTRLSGSYQAKRDALQQKQEALTRQTATLTQGQPLALCIANWKSILTAHKALQEAERLWKEKSDHAAALSAMVKPAPAPAFPDELTLTAQQTQDAILTATGEQRRLVQLLGQCIGQMEALGQEDVLLGELHKVQSRIEKLEDTYQGLTLALETLSQAAKELQRRFAPKLSQRAQDLFYRLTGGRYNRLALGQDLSVSAAGETEDTLRSGLWRSDGTADQLYFALRLAVSGELTPEAPLVLDDALVRFDDDRLALAMAILKEESQQKQVILFTCQKREARYLTAK